MYNIRYYEVELSSYQILDNYIADTPDPIAMLERNARNDIFDENNEVDYDKLQDECPYLMICCPELPQYKGDKKTGVYGRFIDKLHPERSFTFTNAELDVQGTSSAGYPIKNFKVKFNFISGSPDGWKTVLNQNIGGGDVPDIWFHEVDQPQYSSWLEDEYLMDFEPYLKDYPNIKASFERYNLTDVKSYLGGKLYGYPIV